MEGRGKMIEFSELIIGSVEDYDKLYDYVGKEAIDDYAVETLKRFVGTSCNKIVVEYPYHDIRRNLDHFLKNVIVYILWEKMKYTMDILFYDRQ